MHNFFKKINIIITVISYILNNEFIVKMKEKKQVNFEYFINFQYFFFLHNALALLSNLAQRA